MRVRAFEEDAQRGEGDFYHIGLCVPAALLQVNSRKF